MSPLALGETHNGDCHITLKASMIAHRTSIIEGNNVLLSMSSRFSEVNDPPSFLMCDWENRHRLAIAKLESGVAANMSVEQMNLLLLTPAKKPEDQQFIELHVWGSITIECVESVVLCTNTQSANEQAKLAITRDIWFEWLSKKNLTIPIQVFAVGVVGVEPPAITRELGSAVLSRVIVDNCLRILDGRLSPNLRGKLANLVVPCLQEKRTVELAERHLLTTPLNAFDLNEDTLPREVRQFMSNLRELQPIAKIVMDKFAVAIGKCNGLEFATVLATCIREGLIRDLTCGAKAKDWTTINVKKYYSFSSLQGADNLLRNWKASIVQTSLYATLARDRKPIEANRSLTVFSMSHRSILELEVVGEITHWKSARSFRDLVPPTQLGTDILPDDTITVLQDALSVGSCLRISS